MSGALLVAMLGCGEDSPDSGNAALERWQLSPSPAVQLGDVEGAPEQIFSRITSIGLFDDGAFVVADGASSELRVFGQLGEFEGAMGGQGEGPGEFLYLGSTHVLEGDTLLAYDPEAYRLSIFLRSGQLLETVPMAAVGGAPESYLGRGSSGRHFVSLIKQVSRQASDITPDIMELRRYEAGGRESQALGEYPGMRRVRSPVPFSPHPLGTVLGENVFIADGLLPLFTVFTPTGTTDVLVNVPRRVWSPEDARRRLEANLEEGPLKDRLAAAWNQARSDSIPAFSDMLPDRTGAIWVKEYDPGTDSHWVDRLRTGGRWFVVQPDGRALAEVVLPEDFRLMAVGRDRVAGVATDVLGVERVRIYRLIRRKPAA